MTEAHTLDDDVLLATARRAIATEREGLRLLEEAVGAPLVALVRGAAACRGRVLITGVGKSGYIGMKFAATLASTGTPAHFVHAGEAGHGDMGVIGREDLVIAISNSGESAELNAILLHCRRFGVPLYGITAKADSSLGRHADAALLLPPAREACPLELAPMTSTTMTLAICDAVAAALIELRGFRREDFARYHPAGKLGAQLLTLGELLEMRPNLREVARVARDASLADVITAITEGRRGHTAVVDAAGHEIGVITDGDLRRALSEEGIYTRHAEEIMTRDPLGLSVSKLAVDAAALCQEKRVQALFVTNEDGRMCGMVHLQDLLALGVL